MSTIQRSHALLPPTIEIDVVDEFGESHRQAIAAERSLTVYLNRREIVTLMSLGADPEALVVGYLRNQGLITQRKDLEAVMVDWEVEAAAVVTRHSHSMRRRPPQCRRRLLLYPCLWGSEKPLPL